MGSPCDQKKRVIKKLHLKWGYLTKSNKGKVHLQGLIFGELPNIRSGWPHRSSVARHLDAKTKWPQHWRIWSKFQPVSNCLVITKNCCHFEYSSSSKQKQKTPRLFWISLDLSSLFFASVTSVPQEPNARGPPAFWGDCHRKSKRLDLTRQACKEEPTWLSDWNKDETHIFLGLV